MSTRDSLGRVVAAARIQFASLTSRVRAVVGGERARLDGLNAVFHAAYDAARGRAARETPVLVVMGDSLFVYRGTGRREHAFTPPRFHALKSAAHVPIAAYALLTGWRDATIEPVTLQALARLRESTRLAAAHAAEESGEGDEALRTTLETSARFLEGVLSTRTVDLQALEAFAHGLGPRLLGLTDAATRVQLAALHDAVDAELGAMTDDARRAVEVVVVGDHQARVRSLAMQYFQRRFGEAPGEENRVTFAEGAASPDEARALVGTRRIDRSIAAAFFGDAKRLQRDVLGDAAKAQLEHFAFEDADRETKSPRGG